MAFRRISVQVVCRPMIFQNCILYFVCVAICVNWPVSERVSTWRKRVSCKKQYPGQFYYNQSSGII